LLAAAHGLTVPAAKFEIVSAKNADGTPGQELNIVLPEAIVVGS